MKFRRLIIGVVALIFSVSRLATGELMSRFED
jgi:hypothetical protein